MYNNYNNNNYYSQKKKKIILSEKIWLISFIFHKMVVIVKVAESLME